MTSYNQSNFQLSPSPAQPPFASLRLRAQLAVAALAATVAVELISIPVNAALISRLSSFADLSAVYEMGEEFSLTEILSVLVTLLLLVVYIVAVVLFLMWLHRAYRNLPALTAMKPETSPGWAVGSWFIPILNLFRPYRIVKEAWEKSDPARDISGAYVSSDPSRSTTLLAVWWGFWVVSNIVSNISGRLDWRAETVREYLTIAWLDIAASVFSVVAGVLVIQVVRNISNMQETKFQRHAPLGPPPPPESFGDAPATTMLTGARNFREI